ncbi:MAG: ABC transporter permease [Synechococcales bacterium]|nr:ABC transporter permease [Synechococcales bacterium]
METSTQVLFGLGFILLTIALAAWQRLEIIGNLIVTSGRLLLQMIVLTYLVAAVILLNHAIATIFAILSLIVVAAILIRNQVSQSIPYLLPITVLSLITGIGLSLLYSQGLVVQARPWYAPTWLVPATGLLIGTVMNGAAIAAEQLTKALSYQVGEIETHLSLGASPAQATAPYYKAAVRSGLMPTLNTLTIAGLGTLPTLMSGAMLGGMGPLEAGAYQILMFLMGLFASLVTIVLLCRSIIYQFFSPAAQLLRW